MELDLRIVGTLRIQVPFALGQVDRISILIYTDIGMFEPGKILQLLRVFTGDPAGFIKRKGVELNGNAIFV